MERKYRSVVILAIASLLLAAMVMVMFLGVDREEEDRRTASIDDLIASSSERSGLTSDVVIVSSENSFYPLIAAPVCCYYEPGGQPQRVPLLVAGENAQTHEGPISTAVTRFLSAYPSTSGITIGRFPSGTEPLLSASGFSPDLKFSSPDPSDISIAVARAFWTRSDGAVLAEISTEGYEKGLGGAEIAGYLNIPFILGDDRDVRMVLDELEVKYIIACGDVDTDRPTLDLDECSSALDPLVLGMPSEEGGMKSILRDRLSIDPRYITIADPMDTVFPSVVDSFSQSFSGTVTSSDTGSTSDPSLDPNAPKHLIEVPSDYQWANIRISAVVEFTDSPLPGRTAEDDGQRGYVYLGLDEDQDGVLIDDADSSNDHMECMVPTLSFRYVRNGAEAVGGWAYTEEPLFNSQGKHTVELLATLNYDPLGRVVTSTYNIDVTVEKLDSPNYPLMRQASTLAPYLTLARSGVLLSSCEFSIYNDERLLSQPYCGDPAEGLEPQNADKTEVTGLLAISNNVSQKVKDGLNWLLANLAGEPEATSEDLATIYGGALATDPMYVAILGDTNMVPQYYYPTTGQIDEAQQGGGVPGDLFYGSIDADPGSPPNDLGGKAASCDLAIGRVDGWDSQDISALICRSLFYDSIVGSYQGVKGQDWKSSALNTFGSKIPVGTAITVTEKITEAEQKADFSVDHRHYSPLSDFKLTYDLYERSNFIYVCAHGFFYWFVPPGYKPTGVGGGFTVANVYDLNCGPSVLWASSCVTGKIDGIQPYNALSQAFLHSGMNVYIGATRLSWGASAIVPDMESGEAFGAYVGLLFYGHLTGYVYDKDGGLISEGDGDMSVGQAFALAKNMYTEKEGYGAGDANADTIEEFNLHGDPAFNPYEPNHG